MQSSLVVGGDEAGHAVGSDIAVPIGLAIAAPPDARSAAILKGRHLDPDVSGWIASLAVAAPAMLDDVFPLGRWRLR